MTRRLAILCLALAVVGCGRKQDARLPPHYELVTDGKSFSYTKPFRNAPFVNIRAWAEYETCEEAIAGAWRMYNMDHREELWRPVKCE